MPLHFKCNSFLSKIIPVLSFVPCGRVHACSGPFVLPSLSHSASESGIQGSCFAPVRLHWLIASCSVTSGIHHMEFYAGYSKLILSRLHSCVHQCRNTSLSIPAKLNSFKVNEGFRLLPLNIDCFLHITYFCI